MNRKGQLDGIGMFVGIFVTVIVGIALFQASAQNVGGSTDTIAIVNRSLAAVATNTPQYLTDVKSISGVVIFNATNDIILIAANYTITNNELVNGELTVNITPSTVTDQHDGAWLVSGTAQPLGYIDNSGARSVASLIIIFFALSIAVVVLVPTLRSKVMEFVGR